MKILALGSVELGGIWVTLISSGPNPYPPGFQIHKNLRPPSLNKLKINIPILTHKWIFPTAANLCQLAQPFKKQSNKQRRLLVTVKYHGVASAAQYCVANGKSSKWWSPNGPQEGSD
ncbi:hypothetical protein KIL84_020703 [Mauremys mutica]|uniref:Uncharacterized protein n=1 Tax=Mauremys mutica TaxID=74926 RepID=A0A9D3X8T8_9SAUR|nr:hypothetical protein KIL84_020703 [Mauremys mutica]